MKTFQNSKLVVFVAIVLSLIPLSLQAASGDLDTSFGIDGKVTTDFGGGSDQAYAMAIQTDGKIVVVGNSGFGDFLLARYNIDGNLDLDFGTDGIVLTDLGDPFDEAFAIVIQPDGKIVAAGAAGYGNFALSRYNSDGSLDPSFGIEGKVITDFGGPDQAYAVAIQADGKIIAAGVNENVIQDTINFAIARYNVDGSLDTNFGDAGKVTTDFGGYDRANGISVQSDNKIVVIGAGGPNYDFILSRYNSNGSLDESFGLGGKVTTDFGGFDSCNDIAIQNDGKIIVTGEGGERFALARYNVDGNLDATFGVDGKVTTQFFGENIERANGLTIQNDGRIVVVGTVYKDYDPSFALARYKTDGTLDLSFGLEGKVTTDFGDPNDVGVLCPPARKDCSEDIARDVAIQSDENIVVVGGAGPCIPSCMFALSRYLPKSGNGLSWLMLLLDDETAK